MMAKERGVYRHTHTRTHTHARTHTHTNTHTPTHTHTPDQSTRENKTPKNPTERTPFATHGQGTISPAAERVDRTRTKSKVSTAPQWRPSPPPIPGVAGQLSPPSRRSNDAVGKITACASNRNHARVPSAPQPQGQRHDRRGVCASPAC